MRFRATFSCLAPIPKLPCFKWLAPEPLHVLRGRGQEKRKRKTHFAKRNGTFRIIGRKPLKSLWSRNQRFRGIVCFQWLNLVFVSPFFMHARTNQKPGIYKRQSASSSTTSTLAPFEVSCPTAFKSRHRALGREARDLAP